MLVWQLNSGSVTVQTTYLSYAYLLELTVLQTSILMQFNNHDHVKIQELLDSLRVDLESLKKALKTQLCRPKVGVIQNTSGKPNFADPTE